MIIKNKPKSLLSGLAIIGVAVIGSYLFGISYASTPYAAESSSNGTIKGSAHIVTGSNGISSVEFGNQTASISQTAPALMIPAYVYPTYYNGSQNVLIGSWATLAKTKPANKNDIIIANVDTGPCKYVGTSCTIDPNYTNAINAVIAEGWKVYGYVDTGYLGTSVPGNGSTPRYTRSGSSSESAWINQIKQDETQWYKEWRNKISGLFLDDVSNNSAYLTIYQSLSKYASTYFGGNIIFNPGDQPNSTYTAANAFPSGNAMQFFESCYSSSGIGCANAMTWLPGTTPINYSAAYPSNYKGISAVFSVYSAPYSALSSIIASAKAYGAKYLYVSDQNFGAKSYFPNNTVYCSGSPYCNLPSYFNILNQDL